MPPATDPQRRALALALSAVSLPLLDGCVPSGAAAALLERPSVRAVPANVEVAAAQHVVQPGETMWRIARRYGVPLDELARRNGLSDPTRVRAGAVLVIPGAGDAAGSGLSTVDTDAGSAREKTAPSDVSEPPPSGLTRDGGNKSEAPPPTAVEHPPDTRYPFAWPVEGPITARFGSRGGVAHDGIDIRAAIGTPVRAAAGGKVVFSGRHGSYGNLVILRHDDGLVTVYAHHSVNLVRRGQHVLAGQLIGRVGGKGNEGVGRLHFEVRHGVEPRNPLTFLPP